MQLVKETVGTEDEGKLVSFGARLRFGGRF